jgi:dolichyl-phosphate-mannose-protein mannosyltransferase
VGAATKWIVLYAAAGLAAIFVVSYIAKAAAMFTRGVRTEEGYDESGAAPLRALAERVRFLAGRTVTVFLFSLLVFVILPAAVYVGSYIPFMAARGPVHPDVSPLQLVINEQVSMYTYHAGLTATHPYSSFWYEWPLMTRPLWYYTGRAFLPASSASDIYAFGNPVVWWTGTAAALGLALSILIAGFLGAVFLLRRLLKRRLRPDTDEPEGGTRTGTRLLRRMALPGLFILAALAAQYVPWIVNPRQLTFIYHFFASVPFIILGLVHVVRLMTDGRPRLRWIAPGLMAGALLLFILFYPLLSGALVDTSYVETFLRWFPGWFQYL